MKKLKAWLDGLDLVGRVILTLFGIGLAVSPLAAKWWSNPSAKAVLAYQTGEIYFKARDYDRAEASFSRAVDLHPGYGDALFYRARARASKHEFAQAVEDLHALRKIEPENARGYTLAGYSYYSLRDFPQAEVELSQALRISPDDPLALFTRAQYHAWRHDYARTVTDLQRLLVSQPTSQKSLFLLAGAQSRLGDVDKALANCRQLVRLARKDVRYPELCGVISHRAGKLETALAYYREALKLAPSESRLQENLDRALSGRPPLDSKELTGL